MGISKTEKFALLELVSSLCGADTRTSLLGGGRKRTDALKNLALEGIVDLIALVDSEGNNHNIYAVLPCNTKQWTECGFKRLLEWEIKALHFGSARPVKYMREVRAEKWGK